MPVPKCIPCNHSMDEKEDYYECPECGATADFFEEKERYFSSPIVVQVVEPRKEEKEKITRNNSKGKKLLAGNSKSIVKTERIGKNKRRITLRDGETLIVGPRPRLPYFP